MANSYRAAISIVDHIHDIKAERDVEKSKSSKLGTNHMLSAKFMEDKRDKDVKARQAGPGEMTIKKQNQLFPNNIEYKLQ